MHRLHHPEVLPEVADARVRARAWVWRPPLETALRLEHICWFSCLPIVMNPCHSHGEHFMALLLVVYVWGRTILGGLRTNKGMGLCAGLSIRTLDFKPTYCFPYLCDRTLPRLISQTSVSVCPATSRSLLSSSTSQSYYRNASGTSSPQSRPFSSVTRLWTHTRHGASS